MAKVLPERKEEGRPGKADRGLGSRRGSQAWQCTLASLLASQALDSAKLPLQWAPHLLSPPQSSEALALKIGANRERRQMGSGACWPPAFWLTAGRPGNSLCWQQAGQARAGSHVVHHIPARPWPEEEASNTACLSQGWGLQPHLCCPHSRTGSRPG